MKGWKKGKRLQKYIKRKKGGRERERGKRKIFLLVKKEKLVHKHINKEPDSLFVRILRSISKLDNTSCNMLSSIKAKVSGRDALPKTSLLPHYATQLKGILSKAVY